MASNEEDAMQRAANKWKSAPAGSSEESSAKREYEAAERKYNDVMKGRGFTPRAGRDVVGFDVH